MSMTNLNVRVDSKIKQQAEELFNSLGLNMSTAINVFLRQSIEAEGLPFIVRHERFKRETLAFQETEDILAGKAKAKRYSSAEELFQDLDAEDGDDK